MWVLDTTGVNPIPTTKHIPFLHIMTNNTHATKTTQFIPLGPANWWINITLLWWTFLMAVTDGIAQTIRLLLRLPNQWPNTVKSSGPLSKSTQPLPTEPSETTNCKLVYSAIVAEASLLRRQSSTTWRLKGEGRLLLVDATSPSSWLNPGGSANKCILNLNWYLYFYLILQCKYTCFVISNKDININSIQYMCTNYVNSLVQDSNAKALSQEPKFKHANIGTRSELVCQSCWFTQS